MFAIQFKLQHMSDIQKPNRELTKAEEEVMQKLWMLETAFINDLLTHFNEPKPAYNTVSTIIRILEKKGFVGHKSYGKTYSYFPLVSKDEYTNSLMNNVITGYFENSYKKLVSFFAQKENLSLQEIEEIRQIIDSQIEIKKQQGHERNN